ncbi:MAG: copper amine oxidase [Chloroflexi bacterium]|nr:copper amine oxidase [Chloroflexota bacterium]
MHRFHVRIAVSLAVGLLALYPAVAAATRVGQPAANALAAAPKSGASELRVLVDRTLGEHAFLTVQAMRTGVRGGADFAAAAEALEENTSELQAVITSAYGEAGGEAFGELWRTHLGYIVDYAVASSKSDEDGKETAAEGLEKYQKDFSEFLASANPNLTEEAVSDLLGEHVTQLQQIGQFINSDFPKAYATAREMYTHMFDVGDALAGAIAKQFPDDFTRPDIARGPAADLRVALDKVLGEHTFLSVEAMRAGLAGDTEEFEAARGALDGNSSDLTSAIGKIYGEEAEGPFGTLWAAHIGYYIDYIQALRDEDEAAAESAREQLAAYGEKFGEFLAKANPNLEAAAVQELVDSHTGHLLAQVDEYAAADYPGAYAVGREAYAHSLVLSDALATAIAKQFPDIYPDLPDTATDAIPTDESGSAPWAAIFAASALVGVATTVVARRRQPRPRRSTA